jgi:hypothetical protein
MMYARARAGAMGIPLESDVLTRLHLRSQIDGKRGGEDNVGRERRIARRLAQTRSSAGHPTGAPTHLGHPCARNAGRLSMVDDDAEMTAPVPAWPSWCAAVA